MRRLLLVLLAIGIAASTHSAELIIPAFAHRAPGAGGRVWSSHVYLVNGGGEAGSVAEIRFIPPATGPDCGPPSTSAVEVPPGDSVILLAEEIATLLVCPPGVVGALALSTTGDLHITSRMVNHQPQDESGFYGHSQMFRAVEENSTATGQSLVIGGLLWHVNSCGPIRARSRVGFVNPTDESIDVVIEPIGSWEGSEFELGGRWVAPPHQVTIPPQTWSMFETTGPQLPWAVCLGPSPATLKVTLDGPAVVFGTVVDEVAHDPWTIEPIPSTLR